MRQLLLVLLLTSASFAVQREVGAGQTYPTIQGCLNAAQPGDICNVHAGTYTEQLTLPSSGTVGNVITLRANPGDTVNIQSSSSPILNVGSCSYWAVSGLKFTYNGTGVAASIVYTTSATSYNTFSNNTFTFSSGGGGDTGAAMFYRYSSNLTITGNTFAITTTAGATDCADFLFASDLLVTGNTCYGNAQYPGGMLQDGFVTSGPNLTFTNNYLHDGWQYDGHPDGIVIQGDGGNTTNVTVMGNTIVNFGSAGVYFDAIWGAETGVIFNNVIQETADFRYGVSANKMNCIDIDGENAGGGSTYAMTVKIYNNTLACRQIDIKFTRLGAGSDIQVRNNLLVNPPYTAIYGGATTAGTVVDYNFYSGGDSSPIQWNGSGVTIATMKANAWGEANGLTGTALLNADFTEQVASPTIGKGYDYSALFTTDRAGATRSVPWDIGAYQYAPTTYPRTLGSGRTIGAGHSIN